MAATKTRELTGMVETSARVHEGDAERELLVAEQIGRVADALEGILTEIRGGTETRNVFDRLTEMVERLADNQQSG